MTPAGCWVRAWRPVLPLLPADLRALGYWALVCDKLTDPAEHARRWAHERTPPPVPTPERALRIARACWLDLAAWHGPDVANDPSRGQWPADRALFGARRTG